MLLLRDPQVSGASPRCARAQTIHEQGLCPAASFQLRVRLAFPFAGKRALIQFRCGPKPSGRGSALPAGGRSVRSPAAADFRPRTGGSAGSAAAPRPGQAAGTAEVRTSPRHTGFSPLLCLWMRAVRAGGSPRCLPRGLGLPPPPPAATRALVAQESLCWHLR